MNDHISDSDDVEGRDPDEGDQHSLEDRWRSFLTGEADEKRRQRLQGEEEPEEPPTAEPEAEGDVEDASAAEPEAEEDVDDAPVSDEPPRFQLDPDSERRRAAPREKRITESRLFETGDDRSGTEEDPPEPRTRAEEVKAQEKERSGAGTESPPADSGSDAAEAGPDERDARSDEPEAGSDEREAEPDQPDADGLVGAQEKPQPADPGAPVVVPAKDRMDLPAWRRKWKPIAIGVVLLLVAFLAVREIGGGGGGTAPDEGAAPAGAEAASAVDVDRAEALVDSLEAALGRYRERRQDFDLDRLGCAGLARGYEDVQSAVGELRSAVPYADDLAAGSLRSRYRSLVSGVEPIEDGYADTGCAASP